MIDLEAVGSRISAVELEQMHALKTGALIEASVLMGAVAAGCSDDSSLSALGNYGRAIGLAFQIQDDILDCTTDTETLGKPQGSDQDRDKPTYVSLLGLEKAREKLEAAHGMAIKSLTEFDGQATLLRQLANYVVERTF